jgi:hypothetical protein
MDTAINQIIANVAIPFIEWAALGLGFVAALNIVWAHFQRESEHYRRTYELFFPAEMSLDAVYASLRALHGLDKPKILRPIYAISLERYGRFGQNERYFLHVPGHMHERVDEWFQEHMSLQIEPVRPEDDVVATTDWTVAAELSLGTQALYIPDPLTASATVGTRWHNLREGETLVSQFILFPATRIRPTPEDKEKHTGGTYSCLVRYAGSGPKPEALVNDALGALKSVEHEGAHFTKRRVLKPAQRVRSRHTAMHFPVLLNEKELATTVGWPLSGSTVVRARTFAPTEAHDTTGIELGISNSPRARGRKIAIPLDGMFRHGILLSPTGGGKSLFGQHLILQAIARQDMAVVVIDPGDLVTDLLDTIRQEDVDRVILIDAEDKDWPIGIAVFSGDDPEREAGQIVAMFKGISGDSWGTRLERILRNTALTAAILKLPFYDLLPLLTNLDYRREQVRKIPKALYPFLHEEWRFLDDTADNAKDSVVNKLVNMVGYDLVRNMVAQQQGINFDDLLLEHKIVLVRLSPRIPKPAAKALGQIVLELVWDSAQRQPEGHREASFVFVDEVHQFGEALINPNSNRLAEARKYKQSYWMAHQYQKQLGNDIMESIKHNVHNQIVWRLSPEDAERVYKTYPPFSAGEIAALPQHSVAARLYGSQGYAPTVTFKTAPPPPLTGSRARIIANSRKLYATPVAQVRAEIAAKHRGPEPKRRAQIGDMEAS